MNQTIDVVNISYAHYLTAQEIAEIEHECSLYELRSAAAIDALQIVQKQRRWISDDTLFAIADLLKISPAQLDSVATFYNHIYRKPVGKYVIHVCDSIACWLADYHALILHIKQQLKIEFGETTPDEQFTLLTNVCLGSCDKPPAIMINGEIMEYVTPQKFDDILTNLRQGENHDL
ncbi:NADH-quinone oxidoreductase subunit NuoE [Flocculibacter collagenilyticus]|uniref:NADH-quinone oxidoreductase subunit NuoE n=1 Tax=Flocculibacter collagenilyticus TaxID=2744479 RepID=UPI0018F3094B|nr:NADH-quinone oxidoreductase subunit NuoE [Flocculibacter collagenilyticus]